MKLRTVSTMLGLLLCATVTASLANPIISLTPSSYIDIDSFAVASLRVDFTTDPTIGGGINIVYDPYIVSFGGFTWYWTADDPGSRSVTTAPGVVEIGFSNSSGINVKDNIGQVRFDAVGLGTTTLALGNGTLSAGPLISSITSEPQTLTVNNATVYVNAIPLPGSAWLLGSALLGFVVIRRRR